MDKENQCCYVGTDENNHSFKRMIRRFWNKICRWMFLYIWCSYFYRPIMRFIHRFNLHYAPPTMMSPKYGKREHWCEWCGLRGNAWKFDPNDKSLIINITNVNN